MAASCVYPEYVERMLAGSAVLRTKFPEAEERLGVLRLSEDLETLIFDTSDAPDPARPDTLQIEDLEIAGEEISDCRLDLYVRGQSGWAWRLEFPDARIFGDWSYGLQVLTVSSSEEEISDLLREATELNAKLLEDNLRLQRAVEARDALILQLIGNREQQEQQRERERESRPVFVDWQKQGPEAGVKVSARGIRTRDA